MAGVPLSSFSFFLGVVKSVKSFFCFKGALCTENGFFFDYYLALVFSVGSRCMCVILCAGSSSSYRSPSLLEPLCSTLIRLAYTCGWMPLARQPQNSNCGECIGTGSTGRSHHLRLHAGAEACASFCASYLYRTGRLPLLPPHHHPWLGNSNDHARTACLYCSADAIANGTVYFPKVRAHTRWMQTKSLLLRTAFSKYIENSSSSPPIFVFWPARKQYTTGYCHTLFPPLPFPSLPILPPPPLPEPQISRSFPPLQKQE